MKILVNYFVISTLVLSVAACNNTPTETVEMKEAKEIAQPKVVTAAYSLMENVNSIHWIGFKTYSHDSHEGSVLIKEGEFMVEDDQLVGGSFVIDMNSIENHDLADNQEYKQKLENHLKSPDFFNVAEYPIAKFTITKVETVENTENGVTHSISGNLEMCGNTKNITFFAMVSIENNAMSFKTPKFVIDRTNWEVMYGSPNLVSIAKDKLVDNNIKLGVDLKAQKS